MEASPEDFPRRSFVWRRLRAAGARFAVVGGAASARDFGDPEGEAARARRLGLCDLSPLPRAGFRGLATLAWLTAQGIAGLGRDNRADAQPGGALALRLGPGEALILGALEAGDGLCARLAAAHAAEDPPRCHPVPRQAASFHFALAGAGGPAAMAALCAVDLSERAFEDCAAAQISAAGLNMIAIRRDRGGVPVLHLLGDSASALYAWEILDETAAARGGTPVGLAALRALA